MRLVLRRLRWVDRRLRQSISVKARGEDGHAHTQRRVGMEALLARQIQGYLCRCYHRELEGGLLALSLELHQRTLERSPLFPRESRCTLVQRGSELS